MADLTFFQKYPKAGEDQSGAKSIRLDHPDFGDVLRTTYALGVITDFKRGETNDWIGLHPTVESMVKVKIGDEETADFIPIFYNPKALYWDGYSGPYNWAYWYQAGIKATDFDEVQKCHKRAWLSFRIGDEVVVLLRAENDGDELKPVVVLGFADGVPRIGESVLKVVCGETLYYRSDLEMDDYAQENLGLDKIDLGLKLQFDRKLLESTQDSGYVYYRNEYQVQSWQATNWYSSYIITSTPHYMNYWTGRTIVIWQVGGTMSSVLRYKRASRSSSEIKYRHLGAVGPYLYWIEEWSWPQGNLVPDEYEETVPYIQFNVSPASYPAIPGHPTDWASQTISYDISFWETHPDYANIQAIMDAEVANDAAYIDFWKASWDAYYAFFNRSFSQPGFTYNEEPYDAFSYVGENCKMWLYSPKLYKEALEATEPPEIMKDIGWVYAESDGEEVEGGIWVRLHTKQELQDAEMWPFET